MKLTMKKVVLENMLEAMGFAKVVKFFFWSDKFVRIQAYIKRGTKQALADIELSPKSSGGVLEYYSIPEEYLFMGFEIKLLLDGLKGAERCAGPFMTIEVDNIYTRKACFRVHSELGGQHGDDQHNFTLGMLCIIPFHHLGIHPAFRSFDVSSKPSKSDFHRFSSKCTDWVREGVVEVHVEIPDSKGFEIFVGYDEENNIKKDLVRVEAEIPSFIQRISLIFLLRYLYYFTKLEKVPSDVTISFGSKYHVVLVAYELTKTNYIKFYLGPWNGRHRRDVFNSSGIREDLSRLEIGSGSQEDLGGSRNLSSEGNPSIP